MTDEATPDEWLDTLRIKGSWYPIATSRSSAPTTIFALCDEIDRLRTAVAAEKATSHAFEENWHGAMAPRDEGWDAEAQSEMEVDRLREINVGVGKTITGLRADRDLWRARAETAEADADQLAAQLDRWGYGDFHYGDTSRDPAVLAALAAHGAAAAARGDA